MADKDKPDIRRVMLICAKCRNHDIDDNSLLEIDFKRSLMTYVCRNCSYENRVILSPPTSNYTDIGVGVGRR